MKLKASSVVSAFLISLLISQGAVTNYASGRHLAQSSGTDAERIARLEVLLENLRQELKIPAYSAAIVKDQKVIWAKGFGYADLENKVPATEHTAYHLASLTKTFGSTILMQLVQEGKVKLDDPVSKYGITLESEGVIRVRHLFSHTSEGIPGEQYRYNGNRYAELDKVVQRASGKSFGELLISNILEPLGMDETAPNVPRIAHTTSPSADAAVEAEVKAAVMDIMNGYNSGNVDQIEKRLATHQNRYAADGGFLTSFMDGAEMRQAFQAGLKLNLQVQSLEIAVYGANAISTFIISGTVTPPNGTPRPDGPWRASFFLTKQDGVWKLVHSHQSPLTGSVITEKRQQRFDTVSKILAKPYGLDRSFNPTQITYPQGFSVSAGLISTVLDMAKYDIAVDQNKFLTKETQQLAFTPAVSTKGQPLPYGLGWFTQNFEGMKFIWHYGYWTGNSSLILKVPEKNMTFIIMANSDNLSRPTDLGSGDVTSSPVAMAFLKTFIFPETFAQTLKEVNWNAPSEELRAHVRALDGKPSAAMQVKELITRIRILQSVGRAEEASRLMKTYGEIYSKPMPADLANMKPLVEIVRVLDNEDKTVTFRLDRERQVRIFSIGEGQAGQMYDYGWIENVDKSGPVWEMKEGQTSHAGGAGKNRKVDEVITLPAGNYKLRYKSDDSHAFDHWNSLPPDVNFWGIAIYTR